jgi:hypothetical protein
MADLFLVIPCYNEEQNIKELFDSTKIMTDLSLVIPCYNEEQNIKELFDQISKLENKFSLEVIIVNNGSTDNSVDVINSKKNVLKNLKIVEIKKNIGFGNGIKEGLKKVTSEIVCYTHGDLQIDLENVYEAFKAYKKSDSKKIFVKGSRKKRSIVDSTFTFFMSIINSILFRKILYDIHAQPNLFQKSLVKNLDFLPDDMSLDLYMLLNARINNYKILRLEVIVSKRKYGIGANENLVKKIKYSLLSLFSSINILFHGRF